MALISRPRAQPPSPDPAELASADTAGPSVEAGVHITADGEVIIDLTRGDGANTTDIRCPNCKGAIRVEDLDSGLRSAELHCLECHFRFVQRLTRPKPVSAGDFKSSGRFRRSKH